MVFLPSGTRALDIGLQDTQAALGGPCEGGTIERICGGFTIKKGPGSSARKELRSDQQKERPVGVIDVVHGATNLSEVPTKLARNQGKMAAHLKEVYRTTTKPSIVYEVGRKEGEISFTDEDLRDVVQPHNDALVLTFWVQEYDVRIILIDLGSSSEIMYAELLDKLGLKRSDLRPSSVPLFGFSGKAALPMGLITVQVGAGPIHLDVEFLMVDVPSPYNAIVGQTWIHRMKAVPSTYHQRIRFPTLKGMIEIKGDQAVSRRCLIAAIKGKATKVEEEGNCPDRRADQK